MVVSLSNRKRIKKRKTPPAKKNATTGPNKRMLAPVRQRRGRYADTTSRTNTGDGMALLNAVRSQGKLEALHDQSKKTIGNLEMRLGKAEAALRHKPDGHRAERDGDIGSSLRVQGQCQWSYSVECGHLLNQRNELLGLEMKQPLFAANVMLTLDLDLEVEVEVSG